MQPLRGILLKIGSVIVFVLMASIIKAVADRVPTGEIVFFRSFFAIPVIFLWLALRGELKGGIHTDRPMNHVFRGFIGTAAMVLGFIGLGLLPLPEVTAIGYAAPLLTVVFAAMFLGETVGRFRLTIVGVGLVGVLIVLAPRLSAFRDGMSPAEQLGVIAVLTGAACTALAQIFVRKMVLQERTSAIVFWFSITSTALSLVTLIFGWVIPDAGTLGLLILIGLLGGVGQILLVSGYRYADASLVAPFEYASMLFALIIGYSVFDEVPTLPMLLGAAIIIGAGIALILRERYLGISRARQRKAMTPQG